MSEPAIIPQEDVKSDSSGVLVAALGLLEGDLKAQIAAKARQKAPNEACGFIVYADEALHVMACKNVSTQPTRFFRIHPADYEIAEDWGEIRAVWHSHVDRSPDPSMADKVMSESCRLPFIIVALPAELWATYEPTGYRPPLEGRPFAHGVLDCYSLIRDYYKEKLNIEIPDFERPDDWWYHGGNLYVDHFKDAGFEQVNDLQEHDVIVMQVGDPLPPVPNHAAVYLGDGLMLHHVQDHLSRVSPYHADHGYYAKHCFGIYRHRSRL